MDPYPLLGRHKLDAATGRRTYAHHPRRETDGGYIEAASFRRRKLWVNLPPPRELAAKLVPADRNSAVQIAPDLAGAHYALTGVLTANGPAYAWFHKSELAAGPPASVAADHSPGCSATSQYPVRSDWVAMAGASDLDQGGAALNKYASLLAKVHGWLELADSPADASTANYYTLAMVPASGDTPLAADQPARQGDLMKMALQSTDRVIEKRWVYILDIDCHGKGTLLYPMRLFGESVSQRSRHRPPVCPARLAHPAHRPALRRGHADPAQHGATAARPLRAEL